MRYEFHIHRKSIEGAENRRFHKVMYTAALRLGIVPQVFNGAIDITLDGHETDEVTPHGNNAALMGTLSINSSSYEGVILIARPTAAGKLNIVTFWPVSQHADARDSYTDPLVDTAVDGTPFDVHIVAKEMHPKFLVNAGVSPATLMKILYDQENEELRAAGAKVGQLLEESLAREREGAELLASATNKLDVARSLAESERAEREIALSDSLAKDEEIARLQKQVELIPKVGVKVNPSNVSMLLDVTEGIKGSRNQRAILLHMSDGTVRANNWERDYGARLNLALKLKGRNVRTEAWGGFKWTDWYQNIYPAN